MLTGMCSKGGILKAFLIFFISLLFFLKTMYVLPYDNVLPHSKAPCCNKIKLHCVFTLCTDGSLAGPDVVIIQSLKQIETNTAKTLNMDLKHQRESNKCSFLLSAYLLCSLLRNCLSLYFGLIWL